MTKETDKDKIIQQEAAAALLDEPVRFKVKWIFGIKLSMGIKPLKPGTIVKISQTATRLRDVEESENMVWEMLQKGENLRVFCRIAAIAALNSRTGIALFTRMLTGLFMWRIENTRELFSLIAIVYKQLNAEHFFFTMTLTQGMNFLKKRTKPENTAEVRPSGAPSP